LPWLYSRYGVRRRELATAANLKLLVQFCVGIPINSLLSFKRIPDLGRGVGMLYDGTSNVFALYARAIPRGVFRRRRIKAVPCNGVTRRRRVAAEPGCAATAKRNGERKDEASKYHPSPMAGAQRQLKPEGKSGMLLRCASEGSMFPDLLETHGLRPTLR
jgi:hypothetical protein